MEGRLLIESTNVRRLPVGESKRRKSGAVIKYERINNQPFTISNAIRKCEKTAGAKNYQYIPQLNNFQAKHLNSFKKYT